MILKLVIDDAVYDTLRLIVRGDTTGDGIINALDLVRLNAFLSRSSAIPIYHQLAMDLTKDGIVNIADLVMLINFLSGGITAADIN